MAHVISFRSAKFDPAKERPNPINPIAGESVLTWIRENILREQYESTEPDTEDWGWYIEVAVGGSRYIVGAGGEYEKDSESSDSDFEWLVQVHKQRSLKDKLLGRNKMQDNDPLVTELVSTLKKDAAFSDVKVELDA